MIGFSRLESLIGTEAFIKLKEAKVAVIGLGGVGGFTAITLARCGVGNLILQDYDVVEESNINRQIIANIKSVGQRKSSLMATEINNINPNCRITEIYECYSPKSNLFKYDFSYLADAIDDIENKYHLIKKCLDNNIVFISALGAGRKLNCQGIQITDIFKTSYDPIARILRRKLRADNITSAFPVVGSLEAPKKTTNIGSYMPVVATFGILMADYIIKNIIHN